MSVRQSYPFDSAVQYSFDPAKIEIATGVARLKVQDLPVAFPQSFASSTGFTFDAAKTEFVGGLMRQKSQRPAGAVFGANYVDSINANWGNGAHAGVAAGGAEAVGGILSLANGTGNRYVDYNGVNQGGGALQLVM